MLISSSCLTPERVKGLWNSVFQLIIIANIWSPLLISSPCSKSPHAHIAERRRKHESEARVLIWRRTRFVRGRLITKILHLSERVTHLHIAVPTKTRFYASRIHVLKSDEWWVHYTCKYCIWKSVATRLQNGRLLISIWIRSIASQVVDFLFGSDVRISHYRLKLKRSFLWAEHGDVAFKHIKVAFQKVLLRQRLYELSIRGGERF